MTTCIVFTSRRWTPQDGDVATTTELFGIPVRARLCTRSDQPGALVRLDDGRLGLIGEIAAAGSRQQMLWFLRTLWRPSTGAEERAWLEEVRHTIEGRAIVPVRPRRAPLRFVPGQPA